MTKLMNTTPLELISAETISQIRDLEIKAKEIKKAQDEMRSLLMNQMKEKGIQSWESADKSLQITYIPESESITFDSKALKTECPDVYDAYARITKRNPSVRVTVR